MERRHEVLFEQLRTYRSELLELMENLTEKEADVVPEGFTNNIRWNLGHVLLDQYLWISALTKEEPPVPTRYQLWFGYGTNPSHFTGETPSLSELMAMLKEQPRVIEEKYRDRMEEEFAPVDMGMHTIEQVLVRTIFHEGLHIGAISTMMRKMKQ
ncbi:DinB family protein [Paenibacillus sp. J5C_2022]|uniref:DinB family protein n=1 Tax=Paenibacillus sp. J5C2022 TaxID=2977129 RepID=UPI0021D30087|nr:DinB family protein [Paenibacillus sp. J5C2022]MCU6713277.1 DinB family protein [Paenibacillus sp. J5C2022]